MKTKIKQFTIGELLRRNQLIDLEPNFQRGKVWPISKQQYFLDTIVKGWGVPKIYLAMGEEEDKNYVCIDGKQRLLSIFSFIQGSIKLSSQNYAEKQYQGKAYDELPKIVQDRIDSYKVTVELVTESNDTELAELFKRLQHGLTLNSAEKLKANRSNMSQFAFQLSKNKFFKKTIFLKNTRGSHFAVATQLCLLGITSQICSLKYNDLSKFFDSYSNFSSSSLQAKSVKQVLTYMVRMFPERSFVFSNRANIVSVFLLLSELMKRTDITGKEKKLAKFLKKFFSGLTNMKKIRNSSDREELLKYQNSTIQAADSKTSIKIRHEILLNRLTNYSHDFKKIVNVETKEEQFKILYDDLEKRHGGIKMFNEYLMKLYPKSCVSCTRGIESYPVHVRNSTHHPDHPKYSKGQLNKSLEILNMEKSKYNKVTN